MTKWNRTDKRGGDECLGQALSKCGRWRLTRRLYCAGGGRDRYHWFAYRKTEQGWWEHMYTTRNITDLKRVIQQDH